MSRTVVLQNETGILSHGSLFYPNYRLPGIGIWSKPVAYPHLAVSSIVPESTHAIFLEAPVDSNEADRSGSKGLLDAGELPFIGFLLP